jgi:endonuclease YncB( thermonuclease family)
MSARVKLLFILATIITVFLYGCGLYYDYGDNTGNNYEEKTSVGRETEDLNGDLVKEVFDGDTIVLSDGRIIRLTGINTPEYGMYFFEEAGQALRAMVLDKEVSLEKDVSDKDRYGRLLRYVYTGELFVNLEMVKRGFANCYTYPPDVKNTEKFLEAERYARNYKLGLWEESKIDNIKIEVHYDARGNDNTNLNDEYVILKNTGAAPVDINGWTIKDSGTSIYEFDRNVFKQGTTIYLFTGSGKDGEGKFYWGSSKPLWNNDHDTLYLRDREGLLVEIYDY